MTKSVELEPKVPYWAKTTCKPQGWWSHTRGVLCPPDCDGTHLEGAPPGGTGFVPSAGKWEAESESYLPYIGILRSRQLARKRRKHGKNHLHRARLSVVPDVQGDDQ